MQDLDYKILAALKGSKDYISGEDFGARFGISRQGLWKHINKLVDKGYEISAAPHLGYQLISSPDKLYPFEIQYGLNTKVIGKNIHYEESCGSTQDIAWVLAEQNCAHGTVVVSETQKKGRGRMRRRWVSSRGGLYFSIVLRPDFVLVNEIAGITLLLGLACLYGIKEVTGIECSLKWPNDLFLGNKKAAGILCEVSAEQDRVRFIAAGIGINVNTRDLPHGAVSLFLESKKKFNRVSVLQAILFQTERVYEKARRNGFSPIFKEWQKHCSLWGRRIQVKVMHKKIEAEAVGIDEQGYLILRRDNGLLEKICSGDVIKVNPPKN